ncbi:RNA-binding ASCH domain protein [Euphorbia peplus]|nr:RNA-binding ASCH domain protein [Euphorbia peplus]
MRGGRSKHENYTNPCLTMHQPWASLLIFGIKRIEGRSWPSPIRGRLWIHAASKVPEDATIKAMEDFYREIYAVNGITDIEFPQYYPVSRLLGCVEVVGCVRGEELASWEAIPEGARLEGQTDFCWLCEQPQKLLIPFEMRGFQRVYNLEKKIYESAVRGLTPVKGPMPVRFPLPYPRDPFSLKPGSISMILPYKSCEVEKSSSLSAAIAGARAAVTQFSKNDQNSMQNSSYNSRSSDQVKSKSPSEEHKMLENSLDEVANDKCSVLNDAEQSNYIQDSGTSSHNRARKDMKPTIGASAKIFSAAVRGLKPS